MLWRNWEFSHSTIDTIYKVPHHLSQQRGGLWAIFNLIIYIVDHETSHLIIDASISADLTSFFTFQSTWVASCFDWGLSFLHGGNEVEVIMIEDTLLEIFRLVGGKVGHVEAKLVSEQKTFVMLIFVFCF